MRRPLPPTPCLLHFASHHLSMSFVAILKPVHCIAAAVRRDVMRRNAVWFTLHRWLISFCDLPQTQRSVVAVIDSIGQMSSISFALSLCGLFVSMPQCNCNYAEFIRLQQQRQLCSGGVAFAWCLTPLTLSIEFQHFSRVFFPACNYIDRFYSAQ